MRELGTHCTNEECHEIQWSCGTNNLSPLRAAFVIAWQYIAAAHAPHIRHAPLPPHSHTARTHTPRASSSPRRASRRTRCSRISLLSRALPAPSLTARPRGRRPHLAPRLTRGK